MRVAFAIKDDLHDYAQSIRFDWPQRMEEVEGAQVAVIHRSGRFQAELCCVRGGFLIPAHVHPHADTIEIGVCGAVRLFVNGIDPFSAIPDDRLPAFTRGRGIRINHNDQHGGIAIPGGAWFLSVQRWDCEPRSVLTDYMGEPLGHRHDEMRLA